MISLLQFRTLGAGGCCATDTCCRTAKLQRPCATVTLQRHLRINVYSSDSTYFVLRSDLLSPSDLKTLRSATVHLAYPASRQRYANSALYACARTRHVMQRFQVHVLLRRVSSEAQLTCSEPPEVCPSSGHPLKSLLGV